MRRRARCVSCRKPTFHIASSSSCVLLCVSVFSRERDSLKTPYPGRLMPRAYEHICLSRSVFHCPSGESHELAARSKGYSSGSPLLTRTSIRVSTEDICFTHTKTESRRESARLKHQTHAPLPPLLPFAPQVISSKRTHTHRNVTAEGARGVGAAVRMVYGVLTRRAHQISSPTLTHFYFEVYT